MAFAPEHTFMRLVGGTEILPEGEGASEILTRLKCTLIPRLATLAQANGVPARYVGFRSSIGAGQILEFFGIEIAEGAEMPADLVAWELGQDSLRITQPGANGARAISQHPIAWIWRDASSASGLGEFRYVGAHASFWMTANAYLRKSTEDPIEIVEYDPAWPDAFEEMAGWIHAQWPGLSRRIAHYGSTSIPGMPAKPIIDILIEAPSYDEARRLMLPRLNSQEWEYWFYVDHMIFIRRDVSTGIRTHHLHIEPAGHRLWEGLAFRDYLIAQTEAAQEYAQLKRQLAARYRLEREQYTDAKGAFVKAILEKARRAKEEEN